MVDVDIGSLTTMDPFDAPAIQAALKEALAIVIRDGKINGFEVAGIESVDIGEPEIGKTVKKSIKYANSITSTLYHFKNIFFVFILY